MSRTKSSLASLIILGVFAVIAGALFLNRQLIIDSISVWQFKPSNEIAALATDAGLSDNGRFIYYASQPSVESTQIFNNVCGRSEQSTAILGCYANDRIYVYDITNQKLNGIKEVTAAHEMLHAAYQRLGDADKKTVNTLLDAEYEKLKNDAKFSERMQFYARAEPGERENELHSIVGTEVASVSPALEKYYGRYFSDRQKVVALHEKYSTVFKDLEAKTNQLSASIKALSKQIEDNTNQYNIDVKVLNQDITDYNARASSGGFSSQSQFNAQRADLSNRATTLDQQRQAIAASIVTYDQQRKELQSISSESDALNRSIDSTLAPAPSLT